MQTRIALAIGLATVVGGVAGRPPAGQAVGDPRCAVPAISAQSVPGWPTRALARSSRDAAPDTAPSHLPDVKELTVPDDHCGQSTLMQLG